MKLALLWLLGVVLVASGSVWAYMQHPKFGDLPTGDHLSLLQTSPNYRDGQFQNLIDTPMFTQDQSFMSVLFENLTADSAQLRPEQAIPAQPLDFHALDPDEDLVIWLGHSSFYVQMAGKRILIDPVFSDYAAPVPFVVRAFDGTSRYTATDLPAIDYLLITHDHWDHLDYASIQALQPKVGQVITPLGVGGYLRNWGFSQQQVMEGDWYDAFDLNEQLKLHLIPARHFSGRLLTRGKTLWAGFVLEGSDKRLLFSGDTGYGPHFKEIATRFDGFDLVALDHGQYDDRWAHVHMTPEQAAQAAEELGAKTLLPAHVGKFALAKHAWDEPFQRITAATASREVKLLTPQIGDQVSLDALATARYSSWWE